MSAETTVVENDHNTIEPTDERPQWFGANRPMKASYGKLMMWYFLLSDAFTFSAFLIAYGALRATSEWWPDPNMVFNAFPGIHQHLTDVGEIPGGAPLAFVSVMTFILILSSVFVVRAVQEGHQDNKKGVLLWMGMGIVGGVLFLGCQAIEWTHLIHEGLRPWFNPFYADPVTGETGNEIRKQILGGGHPHFGKELMTELTEAGKTGPKAFGALFFGITGFHGFHVLTGICLNIYGFVGTLNGTFANRKNKYEMIEKLGLYWHFVDLVWVFVFLAFYLL